MMGCNLIVNFVITLLNQNSELKGHQKHANLAKPIGGRYHRIEIGLVGANCSTIRNTAKFIKQSFREKYTVGYLDADHGSDGKAADFFSEYVDKIDYRQLSFHDNHVDFSLKSYLQSCDLALVNSNHFAAERQLVIISKKKKESLKRKLDRLNNVMAFILEDDINEPFEFLKNNLPNYPTIPILRLSEREKIAALIDETIRTYTPPLSGLVLCGGESKRMGQDKGNLQYYGKPHREYLADLLTEKCGKCILSVRPGQEVESPYAKLHDTFTGLGPFGAILSAFRYNPNHAYLTLPCDVPFVDENIISDLITKRDVSKIATCYHNEQTGFPEPLITIWEPRSYSRLLHFLSIGYSCPRKVLINSDIKELKSENELVLFNANTPEDLAFAKSEVDKLISESVKLH